MAFPAGPFSGPPSEPEANQGNTEVQRLESQLKEMNQKFEQQRNLLLQSTNNHNQELNLLRKQLEEAVTRNTGRPQADPPAGKTDSWMDLLGMPDQGNGQQPQQNSKRPLTEEEVRRIYQEEENRKLQAQAMEHQKVEQLNARFQVEHPELAKDPNAVALIRNQFLALSQVRPDLTAEQRYQFAVDNVTKDLLPNLKIPAKGKDPDPKKQPASNPYMPNIFQAPPGRGNVQDVMTGMIDNRSVEEKYAAREKQMREWSQKRTTSPFGI